MSDHPLHQVPSLHVPAEQFLPILEDRIPKLIPKWVHLIPVTASLSSFDMMMLLLWLNLYRIKVVTPGSILTSFKCCNVVLFCNVVIYFFVIFLTPFGRRKFWNCPSSMFHSLKPFNVVAQHHFSVLQRKDMDFINLKFTLWRLPTSKPSPCSLQKCAP